MLLQRRSDLCRDLLKLSWVSPVTVAMSRESCASVTRNDVKMQVIDGLTRIFTIELRDRNSIRSEGLLGSDGDAVDVLHQRSDERRGQFEKIPRASVLGDDEKMPPRLRKYVHEREDVPILKHFYTGHFTAQDFGKEVVVIIGAVQAHDCLLRCLGACRNVNGNMQSRTSVVSRWTCYVPCMTSAPKFELQEDEKPFDPPDGEKPKAQRPRDAATLILVRGNREVMLGQRAKGHVFMPDKWVFPGGRVDPGDARATAACELTEETAALLQMGGVIRRPPRAFAMAAVRETREEAGLLVGGAGGPDLSQLKFIARAITPPYRPRRFDARFFLADAEAVLVNDEPEAGEELLHTRWFSLDDAERLDLPSITRFILREVRARLGGEHLDPPYLRWNRGAHSMERLKLPTPG